jgi:hypothetical protein
MIRSPRQRLIYLASIPFAVAPIGYAWAFGPSHGYDLRYLWLAFATLAGVSIVMQVGRARRQQALTVIGLALVGMLVALLFAFVVARITVGPEWALSSTALVTGMWFSASWAISHVLDTMSRVERIQPSVRPPDA